MVRRFHTLQVRSGQKSVHEVSIVIILDVPVTRSGSDLLDEVIVVEKEGSVLFRNCGADSHTLYVTAGTTSAISPALRDFFFFVFFFEFLFASRSGFAAKLLVQTASLTWPKGTTRGTTRRFC